MAHQLPLLINGEFVASQTDQWIAVTNPATQETLCEAPAATAEEMEQAIAAGKAAFQTWKEVPVSERARLMLRYQALLKEHHDEIAEILSQETGKTFEDAKGDVWRGIEVAEQAANIASLMMGETVENVARSIDTHSWTHPAIKAVSFVGSVPVGQHVYRTATDNMKRAQCFAGAKNHMVIMPDANKEQVVSSLVGSSCGAAGQRCMAISVAVFVGDSKAWIDELASQFAQIRPGAWNDPEASYGPQISPEAKQRVLKMIEQGKQEGATCLLDGSDCTVEGLPDGNWVGPTLFTDVTAEMSIYREEIFGPVLCCVCVDSLDEALELVNNSPYGNGTSIFTANGAAARKYQHEVEVGQVGINVPIPVPLPFFSFTGWKGSFYGDQHAYGKQGVRFYTETKTVTSRWFDSDIPAAEGPNMSINLK